MNKQIDEMANDYYEAMLKARGTLGSMNEGAPKWYAKELYAKGWRKASDVAREIFEEIEKALCLHTEGGYYVGRTWLPEQINSDVKDAIAELKKKYESKGADDEQT